VIVNPRRSWTVRALGRHPLTRRADRVQAWAVVGAVVLLIFAAHHAADYSRTAYAARSQTYAAEAASRHPVDATAVTDGSTSTKGPISAATLTYSAHVQWFTHNATHDGMVKVDHPVKAGEHVGIWVTEDGTVTTPPLTDDNAHADAIGVAALMWLMCVALVGGAFEMLRRGLDRVRRRAWDRELQLLVDDCGGSSTTRTP
jgi:hypothetical protein